MQELKFPHTLKGDLSAAEARLVWNWGRNKNAKLLGGENEKIVDVLRQASADQTLRQLYDLIIIDGKKDKASVEEDIRFALHRMAPGGHLAFCSYGMHYNQGVTAAADEQANKQLWRLVDRADSIAVFKVT